MHWITHAATLRALRRCASDELDLRIALGTCGTDGAHALARNPTGSVVVAGDALKMVFIGGRWI